MPLRRAFLEFHWANPWVYKKLVEICIELQEQGYKLYSMRTLIAHLRYTWDRSTSGSEVRLAGGVIRRVKLNDHHTAYYARLLAYKRPRFRSFFEFRRVAGEPEGVVVLFSDLLHQRDIVLGANRTRRICLRAAIRRSP